MEVPMSEDARALISMVSKSLVIGGLKLCGELFLGPLLPIVLFGLAVLVYFWS